MNARKVLENPKDRISFGFSNRVNLLLVMKIIVMKFSKWDHGGSIRGCFARRNLTFKVNVPSCTIVIQLVP